MIQKKRVGPAQQMNQNVSKGPLQGTSVFGGVTFQKTVPLSYWDVSWLKCRLSRKNAKTQMQGHQLLIVSFSFVALVAVEYVLLLLLLFFIFFFDFFFGSLTDSQEFRITINYRLYVDI